MPGSVQAQTDVSSRNVESGAVVHASLTLLIGSATRANSQRATDYLDCILKDPHTVSAGLYCAGSKVFSEHTMEYLAVRNLGVRESRVNASKGVADSYTRVRNSHDDESIRAVQPITLNSKVSMALGMVQYVHCGLKNRLACPFSDKRGPPQLSQHAI